MPCWFDVCRAADAVFAAYCWVLGLEESGTGFHTGWYFAPKFHETGRFPWIKRSISSSFSTLTIRGTDAMKRCELCLSNSTR